MLCRSRQVFTSPNRRYFKSYFRTSGQKGSSSRYGSYQLVSPGRVSQPLSVPLDISCPPWSVSGVPDQPPETAVLWTDEQLMCIRRACQLAARVLRATGARALPGTTTDALDRFAHDLCLLNGAYPSPLNYRRFPKSICTSVNNVACHGIPDDRALQDGDIINVDVTVYVDGFHGDCSATFPVGSVDAPGMKLIDVARRCRDEAIAICKPGVPFSFIGDCIDAVVSSEGYSVVPAFIGHGIGSYFHGPPDVYHSVNGLPGVMTRGMTFTVEPVISQGGPSVVILEDGWTAVSEDESRSAVFEHTILITDDGAEVLTKPY